MASYREAFALTKEQVRDATPPGTVVLISHDLERTQSGHHDIAHDHIQLNPTPSSHAADPLNWPRWRKYAVLSCMSLWAWLSNFQSASISSAFPLMITIFIRTEGPIAFTALIRLLSVNVLMLGASNILWVPLANTFGRRPVILLSLLMLVFFSVWAALAKSYDSLLAARLFMGFAAGPAETIAPDVVGEIFFVHERGRAMAVYTLMLALGPIIGGTTGSYIAAAHGWRWINWTNVILSACTLGLCFFFQPETLFDRQAVLSTDKEVSGVDEKTKSTTVERTVSAATGRFTFASSLKLLTYRGNFMKHLISPFFTLRFPGVWVVMLQYAGLVSGIVTVSSIAPQLVSAPPYLWKQNAGLINLGGIVGTVLGAVYTYAVSDRILKQEAKRKADGYAEPEARLKTQIPALALGTCGLWVFGACAAHPGPRRWVGLQFGYGMLAFALMQAPSVGFNYLIEAYNSVSSDCFVMVCLMRSIVAFTWTFFVSDWVHDRGPMEPFGIFGMLMGIFTFLTLPLIIWGKRTRIATEKWLPKESTH